MFVSFEGFNNYKSSTRARILVRIFLLPTLAVLIAGCVVEGPSTTVSASKKPTASIEMYYEALQCENPWTGHGGAQGAAGSAEEGNQIRSYYAEQGVTMSDVRFEHVYEGTCAACGCPRGDWAITTVLGEDVEQAQSLGWQDYAGPPT